MPVKVVVNPYGRLPETGVGNNVGTTSIFVQPKAKLSQTLTFAQPADPTLGDDPFTVNATASSGLAITYRSETPAVCTVAGSLVTLVTCRIVASQGGDSVFAAAPEVEQAFDVIAPPGDDARTYLPGLSR